MKKSIFKRIVSAALALTMLASMAVGMSTSVSAATNAVPGNVNFKGYALSAKRYNEDLDYMADPDVEPNIIGYYLKMEKRNVENGNKYRVRVIYTNRYHLN